MTLCEVATYRTFVAILHSKFLADHPNLRMQWLEVMDTLGSFVDMIPSHGEPEMDLHARDLLGKDQLSFG